MLLLQTWHWPPSYFYSHRFKSERKSPELVSTFTHCAKNANVNFWWPEILVHRNHTSQSWKRWIGHPSISFRNLGCVRLVTASLDWFLMWNCSNSQTSNQRSDSQTSNRFVLWNAYLQLNPSAWRACSLPGHGWGWRRTNTSGRASCFAPLRLSGTSWKLVFEEGGSHSRVPLVKWYVSITRRLVAELCDDELTDEWLTVWLTVLERLQVGPLLKFHEGPLKTSLLCELGVVGRPTRLPEPDSSRPSVVPPSIAS